MDCKALVTSDGLKSLLYADGFVVQAFVDKFRYNAKRASLVQSRLKAIERLADVDLTEDDPEYIFRCVMLSSSHKCHLA